MIIWPILDTKGGKIWDHHWGYQVNKIGLKSFNEPEQRLTSSRSLLIRKPNYTDHMPPLWSGWGLKPQRKLVQHAQNVKFMSILLAEKKTSIQFFQDGKTSETVCNNNNDNIKIRFRRVQWRFYGLTPQAAEIGKQENKIPLQWQKSALSLTEWCIGPTFVSIIKSALTISSTA